ncbi:MAG TPA: hypothetical protein VE862_06555 [Candidatus Acidoferrum sp.]|nr:hypothetical protein [Candidatus Acidoferrum sp.]
MSTAINVNSHGEQQFGKAIYPLVVKSSLMERLHVRLTGRVKLFNDPVHFSKPTEIYLFYCRKHHLWQMDYMHGNQSLDCARCLEL